MSDLKEVSVLVIDDVEDIAELLVDDLNDEGFKAEMCTSGTEAIKKIENGNYKLIISDINLGDITGIDIFKDMKAKGLIDDCHFFLATGDLLENEKELIESGIAGIYVKPFDIIEFVEKVHSLFVTK